MKTIGIIGGMSAHSTLIYYERLNELAAERLGGLHSAPVLIWSVDFAPIAAMQAEGRWQEAGRQLADIATRLEAAGAGLIVLATNTMHKVADAIEARISVPFVHIADATAAAIRARGLRRPALMATGFTMQQTFYTDRLRAAGLDVQLPSAADQAEVHRIIYEELCKGVVTEASRRCYEAVASRLAAGGADSLILGCTEIGMLLGPSNVSGPVFDTTLIHAERAFDLALEAGDLRDDTGATGTHG